jgi:hypothetical protein
MEVRSAPSGLASGLALAVRPAGLAEVSRVHGAPSARRGGWRGRPGQCVAFRPGSWDILLATAAPGATVTAWR